MSKDAYYFSHDSNARTDIKMVDMMYDYGMAGYGMFWFMVEVMRDSNEYKLENNKSTWRALAMQMHSKSDEVQEFINKCITEYKLFDTDGIYFWSNSLLRRMEKLEDVRAKRKAAAEKRWGNNANALKNNANALQEDNNCNSHEMQFNAKESKRKEKKAKESIIIYKDIENIDTVKITEENYNKLIEKWDKNYVDGLILRMDNYCLENSKEYKSYYKAILAWINKDGDNAVAKKENIISGQIKTKEPPSGFKDW